MKAMMSPLARQALREQPQALRQFLAGTQVRVMVGGKAYRMVKVGRNGKEIRND